MEKESEAFVELAKAADFSDAVCGNDGWWRRLAKALVEHDRMLYIQESTLHTYPQPDTGAGASHGSWGEGGGGCRGDELEDSREKGMMSMKPYETCLCKMAPLEASPKNDIIVAWPRLARLRLLSRSHCSGDPQGDEGVGGVGGEDGVGGKGDRGGKDPAAISALLCAEALCMSARTSRAPACCLNLTAEPVELNYCVRV